MKTSPLPVTPQQAASTELGNERILLSQIHALIRTSDLSVSFLKIYFGHCQVINFEFIVHFVFTPTQYLQNLQ